MSKYSIACKEAHETHYWLLLISAAGLLDVARLKPHVDECNELLAILTSIIIKMRAKKGVK